MNCFSSLSYIYTITKVHVKSFQPQPRLHKKVSKYQSAGVREYWIVDPKRETVLCYFFEGEDYPHMYTFDDIIPVMIYDGKLQINFADIKDRLI